MDTLLAWPSTSKAFSAVQPISRDGARGSPPRKTARLEGDLDYSASGKGKQDGTQRGPRKLNVTHIRNVQLLSHSEDSSCINTIRHALRHFLDPLHEIPFLPSSYKAVFDSVEIAVVVAGKGSDVYSMLCRELERACGEGITRQLSNSQGLPWLTELIKQWGWFIGQLNLLRAVFAWLDTAYITPKKLGSILSIGLNTFEQRVITGRTDIHTKISSCIKEWANLERVERIPHMAYRPQIISLVQMLTTLDAYQSEFMIPYILSAQEFYKKESQKFSSDGEHPPSQFVNHCISRIEEETQRCRDVLPAENLLLVEKATENALLDNRVAWLVEQGVAPLVQNKDNNGLRKFYDLLERVDALESLKLAFAKSVEDSVTKIVLLPLDREDEMIPDLLAFKSFVDDLLVSAFKEEVKVQSQDKPSQEIKKEKGKQKAGTIVAKEPTVPQVRRGRGPFGYAATDAFAKGFSKRQRKPAEMIAKFIDKAMRKGQKGGTDEEFNAKLDAVLSLYQFTNDRDVFRTFYWRALAKRLLLQRSASDDFEKAVIKKLREGYDPEFGKGDDMFKDLALSKDLLQEFHEKSSSDYPVSIMVLQYSCWPYEPKKGNRDIDLPPQMLSSLERYSEFYVSKHKNRKLEWFHSLGTATLLGRFKGGDKDLSVSLYQAAILLLFNDADKLGVKEIKQLTNMEDGDLTRTVQSLACGKKRVLRKIPPGKDVSEGDIFVYNADFTDPSRKVHINSIQVKVSVEESKATDDKVKEDRTFLLDAAIVRIMKSKKRMTNQALVNETIVAVKGHFQPDVRQIKKAIDSLTDREYVRRDETNKDVYHYVA